MQETLFSVREKLKQGEVVTGADVEELKEVEQTTASWDHTQSGWVSTQIFVGSELFK